MRKISRTVDTVTELRLRDKIYADALPDLPDPMTQPNTAPTPNSTPTIDYGGSNGPSDLMGSGVSGAGEMISPTPRSVTPHTMPPSAPATPTAPSTPLGPKNQPQPATGKGGGGLLGDITKSLPGLGEMGLGTILDATGIGGPIGVGLQGAGAMSEIKAFGSTKWAERYDEEEKVYPRAEGEEEEWCPHCGICSPGHECKDTHSW